MTLHLPTLLFASVAMMAMSAGVMTLFGCTQRVYRGFWWWAGAQWLATLGFLLHAFRDPYPAVLPLANLLLLQWPIVILGGVRRFYPRHALTVPAAADALLLAAAFLLWATSWAAGGSVATRVVTYGLGAAVLNAYSAALTMQLQDFRRSPAVKALVATLHFAALVQLMRVAQATLNVPPWLAGDELLLASGLVTVMLSIVMVYLGLLLTYERTERKLRESQRQLRFLADIDMLTEVPNRRHFYELAIKALSLSAPGEASILMYDVDHFKQINDRFGHATGDEALREVARATRETLRGRDVAGRIGGDEFALLLPETSVPDALSVAGRIAARLDMRPGSRDSVPLSLSFGVVQVNAEEHIADAVARADQALYEAKRQGRSRAVVASGSDDGPVFGESRRMGLSSN